MIKYRSVSIESIEEDKVLLTTMTLRETRKTAYASEAAAKRAASEFISGQLEVNNDYSMWSSSGDDGDPDPVFGDMHVEE